MFGFGVYFNVVTDGGTGGGGAPATEIFTANVANLSGAEGLALDPALVPTLTDWSVNLRFNTDSFAGAPFLFAPYVNYGGVELATGVVYMNTDGTLIIQTKTLELTTFTQVGSTVLNLSQDYDLYITHDASAKTFEVYLDGVFEMSLTYTGTLVASTSLTVGGRIVFSAFSNGLDGRVWDIEMFNKLLSVDELAEVVNVDKAKCFALYDQTIKDACVTSIPAYNHTGFTGEERTDQSASGNNASDVGGTVVFTGTAQIECEEDDIWEITTKETNIGQYALASQVGASYSLLNSSQTWTVRFKCDDVTPQQTIMSTGFGASGYQVPNMFIQSGKVKVDMYSAVGNSTKKSLLGTTVLSNGVWYHARMSLNTSTRLFQLFINDVSEDIDFSYTSGGPTAWEEDSSISIGGATQFYGTDFIGDIGQVRIWNRALSDAEGTIDYHQGATHALGHSELGAGQLAGLVMDVNFGSTNVIDNPIEDNTGNLTFSEVGTATYSDQGMFIQDRNLG